MKIIFCLLIAAYVVRANDVEDLTLRDVNSTILNNGSVEDCIENGLLERVGKLLLLHDADDVGEILKVNPPDRNVRLMKLLHQILSNKLGYIFIEGRSNKKGETDKFDSDTSTQIPQHTSEDLDKLSLFLIDSLSSKSVKEHREESKGNPPSNNNRIESQIKRPFYLNPSDIVQIAKSYIATSERVTSVGNNGDASRDKECRDLQSSNGSGESEIGITGFGIGGEQKEEGGTEKDNEEYSELVFLEAPVGEDLRINSLKLDEDNTMFQIFSSLASYLQPKEFPLGLVREAFKRRLSPHILVLQILKLEGLALCWILFWAILSVCLPCAVVAQVCCPRRDVGRLGDGDSSSVGSSNLNNKCWSGTVGTVLYILMSSLLSTILLMLMANDKFSRALERSPNTAGVIFKDVETFIQNTQLQISFVATSSFEIAVDHINKDLQDAENLLGNSFQEDLIAETKIDKIISDLIHLKSGSTQISGRIRELLRECESAKDAATLLRKGLSEVVKQVNLARKHCVHLDRPLCESMQTFGLDLTFSVDKLLADPNLRYLESVNRDNKPNDSVDEAVAFLRDIPGYVASGTSSQRAAILDVLQGRKRQMYESVRSLEDVSKSMAKSVKSSAEDVLGLVEMVAEKDLWRYLAVVAASILMFFIWVLFLCGSPCCCYYTRKAVPCLRAGICLVCFLIMILWLYGSIAFLIGSHGQSIACYPLYEDNFTILSNILDRNGLVHKEGFFTHFLGANTTLQTEEILSNCKGNQPSYSTFHLENRIDIPKTFNHRTWDDLKPLLDNFNFSIKDMNLYSENLQRQLEALSLAVSRNKFRNIHSNISSPIMRRDLKSFHDQLASTVNQMTNPKSLDTFEEIMRRIEEIINVELKNLENHRDAILYELTALEILLQPFGIKIQMYVNALEKSQSFLEESVLVERNIKNYILRLERYLDDLYKHVDEHLRIKIGGCRPLWDVFFHAREHVCRSMVDPMNALSFTYFMGITIFLCLTPLIIKMINYYREVNIADYVGRGPFGENAGDQPIWVTPSSGTSSSSNGSRSIIVQEEIPAPLNGDDTRRTITVHVSPPTPPRRPPAPSAEKRTPRSTGSPTSARTNFTRSRYDSLKVIERTWKTPRSTQSPRKWY